MMSLKEYTKIKKRKKTINFLILLGTGLILGYFVEVDIFAFVKGIPDMADLLGRMLHPNFSYGDSIKIALKETVEMSVFGSVAGIIFSVPFIFITAENIAPSKKIASIFNDFFSVIRTIPSLIWAAVLVSVFSIGKFSGTTALAIIAFLMSQKLLRERTEEIKEEELNSIKAVGANKIQIMKYSVFPNLKKHIISTFFIILESNIRSATILGFVGAGGIGQLMWRDLNHMKYNNLAAIIFILFFVIFVIDFISLLIRKNVSFINFHVKTLKGFKFMKILRKIFFAFIVYVIIREVCGYFSISFERFVTGLHQGKIIGMRMLHPNFLYIPKMADGIFESLYIALFATFISGFFSLIISYFTAYNSSPNKFVSVIFKIFSNVLRTFPPMIAAIIFFRGLGPGKFAGVMALVVYTVGSITKMYSEVIENVNQNLEDSVRSTGASNVAVYWSALVKETYPSFVGIFLYRLESNIRNSTILGIIGAGGIGTLLNMNIIWRNWENVGMMVLGIGLMIGSVDAISRKIRMRIK